MNSPQAISLVTSQKIILSDGRHLSYIEKGVPRHESKCTVIIVHGFASSKHMQFLASKDLVNELGAHFLLYDRAGYGDSDPNPARTVKSEAYDIQELADQLNIGSKFYIIGDLVNELGAHFLLYDRAGYGDSDPNPARTVKSEAYDIQELADQLNIGSKFYIIGVSLGSYPTWGCIKYIPHRLAGVALVVPVINYKWPLLAGKVNGMDFRIGIVQFAAWFAEHWPRMLYWLVTEIWLPSRSSSSMQSNAMFFSNGDLDVVKSTSRFQMLTQNKIKERGVFESLRCDFLVGFGKWEFDPMGLKNPFPENKICTHIWQGNEDKVVPVELQRYVAAKLPWIQYHEVPNAGHLIVHDTKLCDAILCALLTD